MYGWAGCRDWLHEELRRIAGVAAEDGLLYLAGLEKTVGGWQVACLESVLFAPEEDRAGSIAEKTAVLLARSGWEDVPVVLAMPPEDVYVEEMQLPALPTRELGQTAHWEMAAREPFGGAPLFTSYARQEQGSYAVAAVAVGEAEACRRAFAAAGLQLLATAAPPASFCLLVETDRLCWEETVLPLVPTLLEADGAFHGWDERFSRHPRAGAADAGTRVPLCSGQTQRPRSAPHRRLGSRGRSCRTTARHKCGYLSPLRRAPGGAATAG